MGDQPRGRRRWPGWLVQVAFGLAVAVAIVAGVMAVGNAAREALGPTDRYQVRFNEIECPVPPDMDREVFLGEVQYNGSFPDQVYTLDPTLADRLRSAFAGHRKVKSVDSIKILPKRRIKVELTFRGG